MASHESAGLHDPYWYEGVAGLLSTVDMLDPDKGIESVVFQKVGNKGLDDVVVCHRGGRTIYTQVKHTRVGDKLTFGDLVSPEKGESNQPRESLLSHIACAWLAATTDCGAAEARVFTNRAASERRYGSRPALTLFWEHLSEQLKTSSVLADVTMPPELLDGWQEWNAQLACLGDEGRVLQFLKALRLDTDQPGLAELGEKLRAKLQVALGVTALQANELAVRLEAALKHWTTSLRDGRPITAEDVWVELGSAEECVGEHALPPPAPFFPSRAAFLTELVTVLTEPGCPVVFMTGEPGCGKTGVVSALVNRADPMIDLRYHAYRPITPDMKDLSLDTGETATADALWGDLLVQFRSHLAGSLAHHRVPVRTSFLSQREKKREVFRLASVLAKTRGRRITIAIDGIDHAARARGPEGVQFLESLPQPSEVPDDVCVLVVGQPPESWTAYPRWLREATVGVRVCAVPPIDAQDIRALVSARIPSLHTSALNGITQVIENLSNHNTLSAVFAVEEAVVEPRPIELKKRLEQRALSPSLRDYYERIWSSAVLSLSLPVVRDRLAACIAVARERLTGSLLSQVFRNDSLAAHDWNEILRGLRPLLIEEGDGFRVLHNDVRVHLTLHAGADQGRLREITQLFVQYYEQHSSIEAKHSHLFEMARLAGELQRVSANFTPLWVAQGAALDRPRSELYQQAKLALEGIASTSDWDQIHTVSCGIDTLRQLAQSDQWIGRSCTQRHSAPVLASECRVDPSEEWDREKLVRVLGDVDELAATSSERAIALLLRWLGEASPPALMQTLAENHDRRFPHTRRYNEGQENLETIQTWGKLSHRLGLDPRHFPNLEKDLSSVSERPAELSGDEPFDSPDDIGSQGDDESSASWRAFGAGWLASASLRDSGKTWFRNLRTALRLGCGQLHVVAAIDALVERRRWLEIACLIATLPRQTKLCPELWSRCVVLSIMCRRKSGRPSWSEAGTELPESDSSTFNDELLLAYCARAFATAFSEPQKQTSTLRDDLLESYFEAPRDERTRGNVAVLIRAAALAGRIWHVRFSGRHFAQVDIHEAAQSLATLLSPNFEGNPGPHRYSHIAGMILELTIAGSVSSDVKLRTSLSSVILAHARTHPVWSPSKAAWRFARGERETSILEAWWNHWCGDDGAAWSLAVSERDEVVRMLAELASECGWVNQAREALTRLGWGQIGYSGHKDYSIDNPLAWFKCLAAKDSLAWRTAGAQLLAVSGYASEVGDNRLATHVDAAVADAMAADGVASASTLAQAPTTGAANNWLPWDSYMFFHWLIQSTAREDLSRNDLLCIWCVGIGVMWWEYDSDYKSLGALRDGIIKRARLSGYADIHIDLQRVAPLEFVAPVEVDRRWPPRWTERDADICDSEQADACVRAVDSAARTRSVSREEYTTAIERFHHCSPTVRYSEGIAERMLAGILATRNKDLASWTFDGTQRSVKVLTPDIPDPARLKLAHSIAREAADQPEGHLLFSAAENLSLLCLYRAPALPVTDVRRFTERVIRMHCDWAEGFGYLLPIKRPILTTLPDPAQKDGWVRFAVEVLPSLLDSTNTHAVAAALRGIYALVESGHGFAEMADCLGKSKDDRVRYWWLLICERLVVAKLNLSSQIEGSVVTLLDDQDLVVAVQAWVVMARLRARYGGLPAKWPSPKSSAATTPRINAARKLVVSKAGQLGHVQLTSGAQSVLSTLRRIERTTGIDVKDLESRVAARGPEFCEPRRVTRRRGNSTAMDFGEHGLQASLHRELSIDIGAGRFNGVSPVRIAQAILPSDDPFVMLRTSPPHCGKAWPPSDQWGSDNSAADIPLREDLRAILVDEGVCASEIVLGGVITAFDHRKDYQLFFSWVWMPRPGDLSSDWLLGCVNSRTFQYVIEGARAPGDSGDICPLVRFGGGLHEFPLGGVGVTPSGLWSLLGWRPAKSGDALKWVTPGGSTVRFERVSGPPRSQPHDAHHRQPVLRRWIAPKTVIAEIEDEIGGALVSRSRFDSEAFDGS